MRCDQCTFWPQIEAAHDDADGMRACQAVRQHHEIIDGVADSEKPQKLRAARAYVQDADEFASSLVTAPDFFCALFQKRD